MRAERVPAAPEKVPEMLDTPTSQLIIVKIHKESSFLGSFYIYKIKLIRFSRFFIMKYKLYRRIFILFCIFLFRINCIFLFYHYYSAFFWGILGGKYLNTCQILLFSWILLLYFEIHLIYSDILINIHFILLL